MRLLVACECSQNVTKAFRALGCEAYSCDIQDCYGGYPEWHIKDDVLNHLDDGWDMMIGHPPCTYLSCAGACKFYKDGNDNIERFQKQFEAKEFFMKLYNADIPKICLENPRAMASAALPPYSQVIYPELFGANYSKQTLLWLKGLPPLMNVFVACDFVPESLCSVFRSARQRSEFPVAVAEQMALQWFGGV